ncbi:hypothetical protein GCM10027084_02230 [Pseudoxanthomonas sangjuensis]|uniref:hypothetical protein n=1 Tax=Pseudoxanthomonas sangjuensis TaxID=1503750 RepID=UPI001391ADFB|nr:hypothetical protein [Pseudoxanthomonas sangjuensis]
MAAALAGAALVPLPCFAGSLYKCIGPDRIPTYVSQPLKNYACVLIANYQPSQQTSGGLTATRPVYWCYRRDGTGYFSATPATNCVLDRTQRPATAPALPLYSHGYPCTADCGGHEAGYQWAEAHDIEDPDDCGGNSQSFIEGCEAYTEEVQQQMIEDGDCKDADEDERCDD